MRITLVYIQVRCGQPEGPEGNVSRYTMRPGTVGLTLYHVRPSSILVAYICLIVNRNTPQFTGTPKALLPDIECSASVYTAPVKTSNNQHLDRLLQSIC
jgi:hypothetical protein